MFRTIRNLVVFCLLSLLLLGCQFGGTTENEPSNPPSHSTDEETVPTEVETIGTNSEDAPVTHPPSENKSDHPTLQLEKPIDVANEIVKLLDERNIDELIKWIRPEDGVRLTPYTTIEADQQQFSAEQFYEAWHYEEVFVWGNYDGSGEPIELTLKEYFDQFIYSTDYVNAETVTIDQRVGSGNSIDNTDEFYPNGTVVEYHFSGFDKELSGIDWSALRLVLIEGDDEQPWYLIGIIHDQWTI